MFSARLPTLATIASLAVLAVATRTGVERRNDPTPTVTKTITVTAPAPTATGVGSCDTGAIQCCNTVQKASDPASTVLLGLLGVVLQGVDALIGLNCSPLTVVGVGSGSSCNANVVCCQNNNIGGLISVGCAPIIL